MRNTLSAPQLAHSGIDEILTIGVQGANKPYEQYAATKPGNNSDYIRVQQMSNLPAATVTGQGTGIPIYDYAVPFSQDTYYAKRALGIGFDSEVLERDKYNVWKKPGNDLKDAMVKAMRADLVGFINLGASSITTPDGIVLFSASHKLQSGVASNILQSNAALDIFTLEGAVQEIQSQVDYFGDPVDFDEPLALVVPTGLKMLASRLVRSTQIPQSNDNDPNVVKEFAVKVVTDSYITSQTMWTLVPTMADRNPLKYSIDRPPKLNDEYAIINDGYVWTLTSIWLKSADDWRNTGQSSGLGS